MWTHSQPHLFENITALEMEMKLNREFAKVCIIFYYLSCTVFLINALHVVQGLDTVLYICSKASIKVI